MASLILRKLVATDVELNDIGLTLSGAIGDEFDLISESAEHISLSTDTTNAISAGDVIVLDPRDNTTVLSVPNSILAIQNHNLTHYGISGGRFSALDAPGFTPTPGQVVVIGAGGEAEEDSIANIISGDANFQEEIEDIVGAMIVDGTDTTATYDDAAGTVVVNVNDSFLRNDGDTLDSGTLTVAPGATIDVASGGSLTIQDAPVNDTDAANKAYVDSIAQGLDAKESVQAATTADTGFTYADNGGVGDTLTAPAAGTTTIDGVTLEDGDRILIKDQTDPTQNGIYVVSGADAGSATTFTRADDHNASPEVSGGNFTFVEAGTANGATGWTLQGDGELALNTDNLVFTQFSGAGTYTAGPGLALTGSEFALDISTLTADTIDLTDELAFSDSSGGVDNKTTVQAFLNDLDIVNGIATNGFTVRTADNTYVSRAITVDGPGALDGLAVVNGDGVAGDPVIGLDIQSLPASGGVDANNDRVPVWDQSTNTNVYYTVAELAGSVANTDSFNTWAAGGNSSGDASVVADSSADTVTIVGGAAIDVNMTAASDTVEFSLTNAGLTNTAVASGDTIVFFDSSNADAPATRSFAEVLEDLDVPTGVTGTGITVKTGENPDTWETRSVVEDTTAGLQGANVTNGDGVAGDITVGVDINNLTDSADDLAATDELMVFDGTNNVSMSGAQVADGVAAQLGLDALEFSTINGNPVLTAVDTTRGNKKLSVDSNMFSYGENQLSDLDWVRPVGNATDADSGYIMPLDGTIVFATAHTENTGSNTKDLHVFINGTDVGSVATMTGGANAVVNNNTVNLDFAAGDRIRIRAIGSGTGTIQDTVASIHVRWRAA